jgi:ferrous iron transport protein A
MTKPLSELKPTESGRVVSISGNGQLRHRLVAMGVTPGAWLIVRKLAPLGDPMEIKIRNYALSIRKHDARAILVDMAGEGAL